MENCYNILGVDKNASQEKIKKRFKELTLEHHPDKSKSEDAHDKFLRIKFAFDTLSDPEKRRLHDIQIYGIDKSYTEASAPYGDAGLTGDRDQEICDATKVHFTSLGNVFTTFISWCKDELRSGKVDVNKLANTLHEWYQDVDSEMYNHCQRISFLFPDTHNVLMKEIREIRKICGNRVETVTKEFEPRLVNIQKGGSLPPNLNSKYNRTTDFSDASPLLRNYVDVWISYLNVDGEDIGVLADFPNSEKLGRLVTRSIDYPKRMQETVSFIDDWLDLITLKYYQEMDLQKKLKQPKEEKTIKIKMVDKEETKEDHMVTFADEY